MKSAEQICKESSEALKELSKSLSPICSESSEAIEDLAKALTHTLDHTNYDEVYKTVKNVVSNFDVKKKSDYIGLSKDVQIASILRDFKLNKLKFDDTHDLLDDLMEISYYKNLSRVQRDQISYLEEILDMGELTDSEKSIKKYVYTTQIKKRPF